MGSHSGSGPSRTEIWRKLSSEIGGSFSPRTWRRSDCIQLEHARWTITLSTGSINASDVDLPFTCLRAPFRNTGAFRCRIYRPTFFSAIGKWLGMQDVAIGHEPFDQHFIIKANDEPKVRAFCRHAELRQMLSAQKSITLSVEHPQGWFTKFPADTDELRVDIMGECNDPERLRQLFKLCGLALDQLCAIGAAYKQKPSFSW